MIDTTILSYYSHFVENRLYKVLIIYSPYNARLKKFSKKLAKMFNTQQYAVKTQEACKTSVPDITASDIIFFGTDEYGDQFMKGDFSELNRALSGINLAPRHAGIFSYTAPHALSSLERMIADTGMTVAEEKPVITLLGKKPEQFIEKWIKTVQTKFEEAAHDRKL